MLQLLFAVAFSAAPLTLYLPPVRSLNLFVEAIETMAREAEPYSRGAYARIQLGVTRILAAFTRALR